MLNKIDLMGRLTADPDLRYTNTQKAVCSFTLAVERDYQPEGRERDVDFVPCVAWNSGAEFTARHFRKGKMMAVSGRLQSRKWQDKDGSNRVAWEVVAENVYFCGDKETKEPKMQELTDNEEELPF